MNTTRSARITIRGHLSKRLAATFDGMTAVRSAEGTQLVGEIAAQAQLHGLLSRIRDLGLELESVQTSEARGTDGPAVDEVTP
jgi:hypothetical protein